MHRSTFSLIRTEVFLALATLLWLPQALAQPLSDWTPTVLEARELPAFCQGKFRGSMSAAPGRDPSGCGVYFNHYCPALISLNRASKISTPKKERQYALQQANSHLRYTRDHFAPTCSMRKEIESAELRARILGISLK